MTVKTEIVAILINPTPMSLKIALKHEIMLNNYNLV